MELSPSWEAANCAGTQELPSILWNPKLYYRKISGFHGGDYEECRLLGCGAV
jgi:hypothetical protein